MKSCDAIFCTPQMHQNKISPPEEQRVTRPIAKCVFLAVQTSFNRPSGAEAVVLIGATAFPSVRG